MDPNANAKTMLDQLNVEWRAFQSRYDSKTAALQVQLDDVQKKAQRPGATAGGADNAAERKAFGRYLRSGDDRHLRALVPELKAGMDSVTDPNGGFAVPSSIAKEIARVELDYSPLRALAQVQKSSSGRFQQLVSTAAAGAEWRGETQTRNSTTTPPFALLTPPQGEISSVAPITRWLAEDAEFDLEAFLVEEIGKAHGVAEGAAFITGTGVNKPSPTFAGLGG